MAAYNSIEYLKRSSKEIDGITVDTYEYYKAHLEKPDVKGER